MVHRLGNYLQLNLPMIALPLILTFKIARRKSKRAPSPVEPEPEVEKPSSGSGANPARKLILQLRFEMDGSMKLLPDAATMRNQEPDERIGEDHDRGAEGPEEDHHPPLENGRARSVIEFIFDGGNELDPEEWSLVRSLVEACNEGDINKVRRLLNEGRVSVHDTTEEGESLLSLACSAGYYELAQVSCGPPASPFPF